METFEVLEKALALIEDGKNWFQGNYISETGALCSLGACIVAGGGKAETGSGLDGDWQHLVRTEDGSEACGALEEYLPDEFVHEFNDTHTHAEVVALFRKAIRAEKARAGVLLETPKTPEVERVYA